MAKAVRFHEFGGPEVLRLDEVEATAPPAGQVRLAVQAIGLNRADALLRQNRYVETPELPSRLGYDVAATVEAVGDGVDGWRAGDRVVTIPTFSQSDFGVYGDSALVPANALWPWPEGLDAVAAATVGVQYCTVFFAFHDVGGLKRGDTALITAATGGVGFAAIEVARQMGVTTIATTRKSDKADALREAGADHVVVTDDEDLGERVKQITGGKGVQVAFDPIAGKMVPPLLNALAPGGHYVLYGVLDQTEPTVPPMPLLAKGAHLHGYTVFQYTGYPKLGMPENAAAVARAKDFLLPRLADGRLTPKVSETFPLERVVDAHRALESNTQTGKIVLTVS